MRRPRPARINNAMSAALAPEDPLDRWRDYVEQRTARLAERLAVVGSAIALAWWPISVALHHGDRAKLAALDRARIIGVAIGALFVLGLRRSAVVRRHSTLASMAVLAAIGAQTVWFVTTSRAATDPLRSSLSLMAFATVPLLLKLRWRVIVSGAIAVPVCALLARDLTAALVPAAVSAHALAALLSIATGHAIERAERAVFERRRELEEGRGALLSLVSELDDHGRALEQALVALERTRDDERKALARELHDELAQVQLGLRVELELMQRGGKQERSIAGGIDAMQRLLDALFSRTRSMLVRLRPTQIDELGLRGAVVVLVDEARAHTDAELTLDWRLSLEAEDQMAPDRSAHVFRLLQECLTNALRHASARTIALSVSETTTGAVKLVVKDDGVGLERGRARGLGLRGMHERVEELSGSITVEPGSPTGTTITIELALREPRGGP